MRDKKEKIDDNHEQKIECSVSHCAHNCIEDSTCRLEAIKVCPCGPKIKENYEEDTACSSYDYIGDLNTRSEARGES